MDTQKHLYDLIKGFKTCMLVTHGRGGRHARPMAIAELKPDADAYFATRLDSPKVAEIESDGTVLITFQGSAEYAALYGSVTIVRDRALIKQLWSETWKPWFPGGKDDPALCLLKFHAAAGEYWDNSGLQGLEYLFEGMKAILQKRQPQTDEKQHAKVSL
jgi:general stress protein 26